MHELRRRAEGKEGRQDCPALLYKSESRYILRSYRFPFSCQVSKDAHNMPDPVGLLGIAV